MAIDRPAHDATEWKRTRRARSTAAGAPPGQTMRWHRHAPHLDVGSSSWSIGGRFPVHWALANYRERQRWRRMGAGIASRGLSQRLGVKVGANGSPAAGRHGARPDLTGTAGARAAPAKRGHSAGQECHREAPAPTGGSDGRSNDRTEAGGSGPNLSQVAASCAARDSSTKTPRILVAYRPSAVDVTPPVNLDDDFAPVLRQRYGPYRAQLPVRTYEHCFVTHSGIGLKRLKLIRNRCLRKWRRR